MPTTVVLLEIISSTEYTETMKWIRLAETSTPPSFYENTYNTYPTIIAFDIAEEMYNVTLHLINAPIVEKQTVAEYVMVGFGDYLMNGERASLLTQMYSTEFKCTNGSRMSTQHAWSRLILILVIF